MALTEYQKFVKKNASKHKLKNGMVDLKTIGRLWRQKKGGKTAPRKKTTPKAKPRSVSRPVSKSKPKSRPRGDQERKMLKHKKEFDDIARGLGVPLSKTKFKFVGKKWNLKIGSLKMVKRAKLSEAMKIVRKRAKSRV